MSYVWNFTGNFKFEKNSYTTNSLLYLFNSIYFFIFILNFIFRFKPIVEYHKQSKLNNITDAHLSDMELFFYTFILIIPFYVIFYFIKENKNLNYSKWNIVLVGFFYLTVINILAFTNLIVLQLAFYKY